MQENWKKIYSSTKYFEVQNLKSLLSINNINSIIINKQDSELLFGDVELYVQRDNILRAKYIIKKNIK